MLTWATGGLLTWIMLRCERLWSIVSLEFTGVCHHLESLAHVIVSVFTWGACFFLSYPVCHMVEHGAHMGDMCISCRWSLSLSLSVCHFAVPVSASACSHCHIEVWLCGSLTCTMCVRSVTPACVCSLQLTCGDACVTYSDHICVLLVTRRLTPMNAAHRWFPIAPHSLQMV